MNIHFIYMIIVWLIALIYLLIRTKSYTKSYSMTLSLLGILVVSAFHIIGDIKIGLVALMIIETIAVYRVIMLKRKDRWLR